MSILDLFRRRTQDVPYTRVLVCALGEASEDDLGPDCEAYRKHLESVTLQRFADAGEFLNSLRNKYDIVHVLASVSADGKVGETEITGSELIEQSALSGTKLLWMAGNSDPQSYIKGFKPNGIRQNVVMTIDRRGDCLPKFIESLLGEMQSGSSMPVAWNKLAPQIPGEEHSDAPVSIFYAGLGQIRFV
jgi:hypothetical protein